MKKVNKNEFIELLKYCMDSALKSKGFTKDMFVISVNSIYATIAVNSDTIKSLDSLNLSLLLSKLNTFLELHAGDCIKAKYLEEIGKNKIIISFSYELI